MPAGLDGFLHFTSSTTSGSACLMSARMRASVLARQSLAAGLAFFAAGFFAGWGLCLTLITSSATGYGARVHPERIHLTIVGRRRTRRRNGAAHGWKHAQKRDQGPH